MSSRAPAGPAFDGVALDEHASMAHVLGLLDALRLRVAHEVDSRRLLDPSLDDPLRGLYLSEDFVRSLLAADRTAVSVPEADEIAAEAAREASEAERGGRDVRLLRLRRAFPALDPLDLELLVIALAPDVDDRFERFYGYLNDDVTRRRASIRLALALAGRSPASAPARARLGPGGALVRAGLVDVEDPERPFLTRGLRVPDRVVAYLLGDDEIDRVLLPYVVPPVRATLPVPGELVRAVTAGDDLVYVRDRTGAGARDLAAAAVRAGGRVPLVLDPGDIDAPLAVEVARAGGREALLGEAVLVVGPIDALADRTAALVAFTALAVPTVLVGEVAWDPAWSPRVPLVLDVDDRDRTTRSVVWAAALGAGAGAAAIEATAHFRLTPSQVERAARAATMLAGAMDVPVGQEHLRAGARQQNASRLERLARRVEPDVGWDDLVLGPVLLAALHRLADRARYRDVVLTTWHMRPGGGRGTGVTALFSGDSGTGKTMSAEVIARELGLDLYVVNLATVVDKYVGETEKNLDRIFVEAGGVNGVLLFDEADALFGQRSEVRDSHDRYANLEIAYLLQRMEAFDGLAILSTNLRANLDDAFARRLDAICDFPLPDVAARRLLWERTLAPLTQAADLDLDFCASAFELSGGNIRSTAITAAYRVAVTGEPLTMAVLVHSIAEEYRKLGRLCLPAEFGDYHRLLTG